MMLTISERVSQNLLFNRLEDNKKGSDRRVTPLFFLK
jgi:hypothetical protein